MDTQFIITELKKLLAQKTIYKEEAVFANSPYNHQFRTIELQKNTPRLSAVLVLLYPKNNEIHSVLMLRTEYEGKHSGQISFPGGKKELDDIDLQRTAQREFEEEMGVFVPIQQFIGNLTDVYIPPSNFLVSPYVGFLSETPIFSPNTREVAQLIEFPIRMLLDKDIIQLKSNLPFFNIQNQFVWGATALILSELRGLLRKIDKI